MYDKQTDDRVDVLEAKVAELTKHLKTTIVLLARQARGDAFRSPLEKFFDGPGSVVFPNDPVDELTCLDKCVGLLDGELQAAGDNEAAQDAAYGRFTECSNRCGGFPG